MDSVPPDKRVPYIPHVVGVTQSHDQTGSTGGADRPAPVSSLIHPPPKSADQCEVSGWDILITAPSQVHGVQVANY